MRGFITEVADALYRRYGDDISSLRLVFPNRRAQLFFCDALSSLIHRPLWQPAFVSIGELMERFMESLGIIIDETAYHTTFTPFDEAMADQTAAAIVRALNTLRDGVVPETSERQELAFQSYKRDYARRDGSDAESRYWRERGMFDCATFHEYVETRRKLPESVHAER